MSALLPLPAFAQRNGISADEWQTCLNVIRDRYVQYAVKEAPWQGGCSYTLALRPHISSSTQKALAEGSASPSDGSFVVQIRPGKHAISPSIARDARKWYDELAPEFEDLSSLEVATMRVQICQMSLLPGVRLSDVLPSLRAVNGTTKIRLVKVLESLAEFHALAWHRAVRDASRRGKPLQCNGRVGSTILERLRWLETGLPTHRLRDTATRCKHEVQAGALDVLPVVLTHGDLIPSNIMVDPETWRVCGLVDWAEAEHLPFGISLYCVDRLLGGMQDHGRVVWYEGAKELRAVFWRALVKRVPTLRERTVLDAVYLARDIGVLLWHGIAFDEGSISRVVRPGRDDEDLAYLNAYFESGPGRTKALL